jgi:hypothetical protein
VVVVGMAVARIPASAVKQLQAVQAGVQFAVVIFAVVISTPDHL